MMRSVIPILALLCVVVAAPFLFRQSQIGSNSAQDELVIISPHNEAIRFEFTRAFEEYYRKTTGRSVHIDWRLPGGTTEIVRYLNSEFEASFGTTGQGSYGFPGIGKSSTRLPIRACAERPIEVPKASARDMHSCTRTQVAESIYSSVAAALTLLTWPVADFWSTADFFPDFPNCSVALATS